MADDGGSYVVIGTPFEVLDENEPRKKPIPIHEQVVKDEKGRRRFHGAFTGGFSAGYFNTVGSKEGWTPSAFVSSRSDRKDKMPVSSNPEDFMDAEDFEDFGIAPKRVTVKEKFAGSELEFAGLRQQIASENNILSENILQDLILPAKLPIGEKLMKKMGWKKNQGVGPRVNYKKKSGMTDELPQFYRKDCFDVVLLFVDTRINHIFNVLYNCEMLLGSTDIGIDSEFDNTLRDDPYSKGILFAPTDTVSVSYEIKDDQKGLGYKGLNPADVLGITGDINLSIPYKSADKRKGITGQAFGVGALEEEDDSIYSIDNMTNYDTILNDESYKNDSHQKIAVKIVNLVKNRSHGRHQLEGFLLADRSQSPTKKFLPPELPHEYRPIHIFKDDVPVTGSSDSRHSMLSTQRGQLLGEQPIEGPSQSISGLLSEDDKVRLTNISKATASINMMNQEMQSQSANHRSQQQDDSKITEWEKEQEKEDFARTAKRFEVLGKAMAARFTSSRSYTCGDEEITTISDQTEEDSDSRDRAKAASMKLFGKLTRRSFEWHPDKLLCKRFNVADPFPRSSKIGIPQGKLEKLSIKDTSTFLQAVSFQHPSDELEKQKLDSKQSNVDNEVISTDGNQLSQNPSMRTDTEHDLIITGNNDNSNIEDDHPPIDLFKAIFASSDSSDAGESSANESSDTKELLPSSSERGAIANINLTSPATVQIKVEIDIPTVSTNASKEVNSTTEKSYYGPALPPISSLPAENVSESKLFGKSNKHYKSHEHKHKKHKHKHKKVSQLMNLNSLRNYLAIPAYALCLNYFFLYKYLTEIKYIANSYQSIQANTLYYSIVVNVAYAHDEPH
ncbi:G patch domain-containing protein 1 [Trichoplax sp. H2]|nr:G patch domain-containing protein 1 [Trichoplax sp. H2]|eukprot:RDD47285.1 G patch domain-containing protein 1 [Trichoplax sp. H2]